MKINIQLDDGWSAPNRATEGAAGYDLRAYLDAPVTLAVGERKLIPCGFKMEIPEGHCALILPRSGLALKHGVTVLNSPGLIDSDYRGPIHALLVNLGNTAFTIQPGERVAQMVISKVELPSLEIVYELSDTTRGSGGFGSTGTR